MVFISVGLILQSKRFGVNELIGRSSLHNLKGVLIEARAGLSVTHGALQLLG